MARRTRELGPAMGKRLRLTRELRGLTVRELAARAHCTTQTIQRISDGLGGNTGLGTIADLARALGVSPAWLAFGEGSEPEAGEPPARR